MKLTLPYPPSANHYWRNVMVRRNGTRIAQTLISEQGRAYRVAVEAALIDQGQSRLFLGCKSLLYLAPLSVQIDAYPPDRRRRDIDNLSKAVLDAMQHAGVYEDDNQIDQLIIRRCGVVAGGRLEVTIEEKGSVR